MVWSEAPTTGESRRQQLFPVAYRHRASSRLYRRRRPPSAGRRPQLEVEPTRYPLHVSSQLDSKHSFRRLTIELRAPVILLSIADNARPAKRAYRGKLMARDTFSILMYGWILDEQVADNPMMIGCCTTQSNFESDHLTTRSARCR